MNKCCLIVNCTFRKNVKVFCSFKYKYYWKKIHREMPSGNHDDVIKWKHFPRNWPFVREIHRSPVNFPHKGQWRGALMFSLIYARINDWVNNREAGDLRRQHGHYDVIVMYSISLSRPRCINLHQFFALLEEVLMPSDQHRPLYSAC